MTKDNQNSTLTQMQALRLLHAVVTVYRTGRLHALTNEVMRAPLDALRANVKDIIEAHTYCEFFMHGTVCVLNGTLAIPDLPVLGVVREVSSHLNTRAVGGFRLRAIPSDAQCQAVVDSLLNARLGVDPVHDFEVIHLTVISEMLTRLHEQEIANIINRDRTRWALSLYASLLKVIQKSVASVRAGGEVRGALVTERILRELLDAAMTMPEAIAKIALLRDSRITYLQRHLVGTTLLSILVGLDLDLPRGELLHLARVALFHELGMAVYGEHLEGQGKQLSPPDRQLVKDMPLLSARMYLRRKGLDFETLRSVVAAIECKRSFDDPLVTGAAQTKVTPVTTMASRIVQVCSAFDAMTSDRPFRAAMPIHIALEELHGGHTRFDPRAVISLMRVLSGMQRWGRENTTSGVRPAAAPTPT